VEAQSGKKISASCAPVLIQDAQNLINSLTA